MTTTKVSLDATTPQVCARACGDILVDSAAGHSGLPCTQRWCALRVNTPVRNTPSSASSSAAHRNTLLPVKLVCGPYDTPPCHLLTHPRWPCHSHQHPLALRPSVTLLLLLALSSCAAVDGKAEQQLTQLGTIAAYTLDRALVAVSAAAASGTLLPQVSQDLPQGLPQDLPSRLFVHGVIRHVGEGTHTQQQQGQGRRKRMELGGEVFSGKPTGGLEGATLVLTTVGAGRSQGLAGARQEHAYRRRRLQ